MGAISNDQISLAAKMAAEWWGARLIAGDRDKFTEALRGLVEDDLRVYGRCRLECDYDPRGHLLTAVHASGVQCSGMMFSARGILPNKHELDVFPDRLEPKEGYGRWTDKIMVPTQEAAPND